VYKLESENLNSNLAIEGRKVKKVKKAKKTKI
jgi:hypothetical protein